MKYLRRLKSDVWHWCVNCHHYPEKHGVSSRGGTWVTTKKPTQGEFCNECRSKTTRGKCEEREP